MQIYVVWYFFRTEVTRAEFTICLREHFSLPFLFAQFYVVGLYLDSKTSAGREKFDLISIYVLTFLFAITWQFAQFALLLQCLVLFGLALIKILEREKVSNQR